MVSPQMLLRVSSAHDSTQALGGSFHYSTHLHFSHPQGVTESQSKALWGHKENFKESTTWNQCSVSSTGQ